MVSAYVTWNGATKPLFVNGKRLKVNSKTHKKHLEQKFLPEIESIIIKND